MPPLQNARARLRLVALGVLVVLIGAVAAPVQAWTMPPGPTTTVPIPSPVDPYAAYVAQTTCEPTAKPGAQALLALAMGYWKIGRNTGISRACSVGGTSEHKEGRAFDWGLNVNNPAEKAAGDAFTSWLIAAGPDGKPGYNARRLGVMYVIWNKRIWTAYGTPGWKAYTGAVPHTDHVHVSLSWNGAYKRTSWWTGSLVAQKPVGSVETVAATRSSITVKGWALDPDTSDPIKVHVYVDNASAAVRADESRPDVQTAYGRGDDHGFSYTVPASLGTHRVCVYAIDSDPTGNSPLGCRDVVVRDSVPTGVIDTVTSTATTLTVTGWALDPDTTASTLVHVYVDGKGAAVRADGSRPDVGAAFGRGNNHGFTYTTPAGPGRHEVCVYGINAEPDGANVPLGCKTGEVPTAAPIGFVDQVSGEFNGVTVSGWTLDPDTSDPTDVHVYVDGVGVAVRADGLRPDVAAIHRKGDRHGYTYTKALPAGPHDVCVYGINTGPGPNTGLGCRSVTVVSNAAPFGFLDAVTPSTGALTVSGWVVDPDTNEPTDVHVYVDGASVAVRADGSRPDVDAAFGQGDRHGYTWTKKVAPGPHQVCVYGIDNRGVAHTHLGCRTVQVTA